jgi:hypothetical protein
MWARVGSELALASAARVKDGGRVLLIRAGPATSEAPDQETMEKAFKEKIAAASKGAEVVVIAAPDGQRPSWAREDYPILPAPLEPAWLAEAVKAHAPVKAVVSLVGEPVRELPADANRPALLCFAPGGGDALAGMIRSGSVAAAVATRHGAPPKGEKDWFSIRYAVVTSANVEQWVAGQL